MDLVVDLTAGNRHMWGGNKEPDNVIFMDKETRLFYPPTLFASWHNLPFRTDLDVKGIFDPPHIFSETSMYNKNPSARPNGAKKIPGWYGAFKSIREAKYSFLRAQEEFSNVFGTIFVKWNITNMSLSKFLSLFWCWNIIEMVPFRSRGNKPSTWWVKLDRKGRVMKE